jgi:bis(5'-nucleosyl)-tetraphosphatase (symmetrical)
MSRVIWIIGDIHGCVRSFEALLREIRFDPARDTLWCAGDLVNTGPSSPETLRLWRDVGGRAVLGNHDAYALLARSGSAPRRPDRLDALFAAPDADALLARLRAMPVFVQLPGAAGAPATWLVHGGLDPRWRNPSAILGGDGPHDDAWLGGPEVRFATRVRCCSSTGDLARHAGPPETCPSGFRPWDDFYAGDAFVVHGHWAMRRYYRRDRVMGLDSGCVYGGELTAWCVDEDRIAQVTKRDP